jgi:hypothetical protein
MTDAKPIHRIANIGTRVGVSVQAGPRCVSKQILTAMLRRVQPNALNDWPRNEALA